jgi:hypothetical protein
VDPGIGADRRWGALRLAGVLVVLAVTAPQWLLGIAAVDRWRAGGATLLSGGWIPLIAGWLVLVSAPGRALIVIGARRLLLPRLAPGRYPRNGWLAWRVWFVERLAEVCHLDALAGTPWAARYARIAGARVVPGARLGTLPPPTGLISIGAGATLEGDIDSARLDDRRPGDRRRRAADRRRRADRDAQPAHARGERWGWSRDRAGQPRPRRGPRRPAMGRIAGGVRRSGRRRLA